MILPILSSTTRKSRGRMIFPANICVR
jgi:hypothetical protein